MALPVLGQLTGELNIQMFLNAESSDGWYLKQNQLDRVTAGGSRKIKNGAKMIKTDPSYPSGAP